MAKNNSFSLSAGTEAGVTKIFCGIAYNVVA
jgi:hypothetical protein